MKKQWVSRAETVNAWLWLIRRGKSQTICINHQITTIKLGVFRINTLTQFVLT